MHHIHTTPRFTLQLLAAAALLALHAGASAQATAGSAEPGKLQSVTVTA